MQGVRGCRREHTLSHGSWEELPLVRVGKQTRITASERGLGSYWEIQSSIRGYRTSTSLCISGKMFFLTPTTPRIPQRQLGPASVTATQGAGG